MEVEDGFALILRVCWRLSCETVNVSLMRVLTSVFWSSHLLSLKAPGTCLRQTPRLADSVLMESVCLSMLSNHHNILNVRDMVRWCLSHKTVEKFYSKHLNISSNIWFRKKTAKSNALSRKIMTSFINTQKVSHKIKGGIATALRNVAAALETKVIHLTEKKHVEA